MVARRGRSAPGRSLPGQADLAWPAIRVTFTKNGGARGGPVFGQCPHVILGYISLVTVEAIYGITLIESGIIRSLLTLARTKAAATAVVTRSPFQIAARDAESADGETVGGHVPRRAAQSHEGPAHARDVDYVQAGGVDLVGADRGHVPVNGPAQDVRVGVLPGLAGSAAWSRPGRYPPDAGRVEHHAATTSGPAHAPRPASSMPAPGRTRPGRARSRTPRAPRRAGGCTPDTGDTGYRMEAGKAAVAAEAGVGSSRRVRMAGHDTAKGTPVAGLTRTTRPSRPGPAAL